ncbi:leucine-rich repeat-containing protein 59 isoform X3 [Lepidochelys kempii]|uniref:leucine-rich repeat-containing protein 59 isoform X3 n=1 Tax=Lepidochelys kempii TaxID=8472 RepID=UPI003C70604E
MLSLLIMAKAGGKGVNLKDKLDGNELDLSLSDLNEVPVKELAALPKATILDLSCNNLTSLPSDFCSLTHVVKLDLSKNQLQQLPSDFGRLVNLQHLDLLNNRLVILPVSFAQLKVLQHMKAIQSEQDRERQRRLQAEREMEKKREAEQRAREAQERELRRQEKAEEKERRRREYDALRAARQEMETQTKKESSEIPKLSSVPHPSQLPRHRRSWFQALLKLLLLMFLCALSTVAVCRVTELQRQSLCVSVNMLYEDVVTALQSHKIVQNILHQNSQQ